MVQLIEKMVELHKKLSAARITSNKNKIQQQIDYLVYKLYNLTDEEIAIVEGHSKAD